MVNKRSVDHRICPVEKLPAQFRSTFNKEQIIRGKKHGFQLPIEKACFDRSFFIDENFTFPVFNDEGNLLFSFFALQKAGYCGILLKTSLVLAGIPTDQ